MMQIVTQRRAVNVIKDDQIRQDDRVVLTEFIKNGIDPTIKALCQYKLYQNSIQRYIIKKTIYKYEPFDQFYQLETLIKKGMNPEQYINYHSKTVPDFKELADFLIMMQREINKFFVLAKQALDLEDQINDEGKQIMTTKQAIRLEKIKYIYNKIVFYIQSHRSLIQMKDKDYENCLIHQIYFFERLERDVFLFKSGKLTRPIGSVKLNEFEYKFSETISKEEQTYCNELTRLCKKTFMIVDLQRGMIQYKKFMVNEEMRDCIQDSQSILNLLLKRQITYSMSSQMVCSMFVMLANVSQQQVSQSFINSVQTLNKEDNPKDSESFIPKMYSIVPFHSEMRFEQNIPEEFLNQNLDKYNQFMGEKLKGIFMLQFLQTMIQFDSFDSILMLSSEEQKNSDWQTFSTTINNFSKYVIHTNHEEIKYGFVSAMNKKHTIGRNDEFLSYAILQKTNDLKVAKRNRDNKTKLRDVSGQALFEEVLQIYLENIMVPEEQIFTPIFFIYLFAKMYAKSAELFYNYDDNLFKASKVVALQLKVVVTYFTDRDESKSSQQQLEQLSDTLDEKNKIIMQINSKILRMSDYDCNLIEKEALFENIKELCQRLSALLQQQEIYWFAELNYLMLQEYYVRLIFPELIFQEISYHLSKKYNYETSQNQLSFFGLFEEIHRNIISIRKEKILQKQNQGEDGGIEKPKLDYKEQLNSFNKQDFSFERKLLFAIDLFEEQKYFECLDILLKLEENMLQSGFKVYFLIYFYIMRAKISLEVQTDKLVNERLTILEVKLSKRASLCDEIYICSYNEKKKQDVLISKRFHKSQRGIESLVKEIAFLETVKQFEDMNIVGYKHYEINSKGYLSMVTEYCENGSLQSYIEENQWELKEALKITVQIIQAVQFLHDINVIHCDIKPANILLDSNNNAKLIDFGSIEELNLKSNQYTQNYVSPEYLTNNNKFMFFESDIWSLGITIIKLFSCPLTKSEKQKVNNENNDAFEEEKTSGEQIYEDKSEIDQYAYNNFLQEYNKNLHIMKRRLSPNTLHLLKNISKLNPILRPNLSQLRDAFEREILGKQRSVFIKNPSIINFKQNHQDFKDKLIEQIRISNEITDNQQSNLDIKDIFKLNMTQSEIHKIDLCSIDIKTLYQKFYDEMYETKDQLITDKAQQAFNLAKAQIDKKIAQQRHIKNLKQLIQSMQFFSSCQDLYEDQKQQQKIKKIMNSKEVIQPEQDINIEMSKTNMMVGGDFGTNMMVQQQDIISFDFKEEKTDEKINVTNFSETNQNESSENPEYQDSQN